MDWGAEWVPSLLWILRAWAIAAVVALVVLFLLGRFTVWGRQYWRVTGDYFRGRAAVKIWIWLAVLLLSVMISVRINVLLSFFSSSIVERSSPAEYLAGRGPRLAPIVACRCHNRLR
jgi:putative ATP-binding cassette transporter